MKINIKNKSKKYDLEVEPSMTIKDVKEKIEKDLPETGLKAKDMKIIFSCKICTDEKTVEQCNIVENASLFVAGVTPKSEEPKSINQPSQPQSQQQPGQYQQQPNMGGNSVFNMGNDSFKNLMSQQFDMILANPDLFDQYLGPMFANLDPATRESRKNQMLEQMRMLKDNPQMMEGILDQMKSMDPNAMQQMMNSADPSGMGMQGMGMPGGMPNQQPYNPYMQVPQMSPTVPCSHGFYPYGYVMQPQMMYPPQQNYGMQQNVSPKFDPNVNYEELYKEQLKQLEEMGFDNKEVSLKALKITNGDVGAAVNVLCNWSQQNK